MLYKLFNSKFDNVIKCLLKGGISLLPR